MSIVEQKPITKGKTSKYNITIKSTEDRKEYDRQLYQLRKEEKQKQALEYRSQHKEEHCKNSNKYAKKYREGFKVLKDMYKDNTIPDKYKEKIAILFKEEETHTET